MKRTIIALVAAAILVPMQAIEAQQAVNDALSQAEKVSFETNKKQLKKEQKALKSIYAKALKEIASLQAAAQKKPENYVKMADECHLWADLQTRMERLVQEGKWAAVEHVNYDSLQTDIRAHAAKYYYDEGRKQCESSKKMEQKQIGLATMEKANKYDTIYATNIVNYRDSVELPYAHTLAQSNKEADQIEALTLFNAIIARHEGDSAMVARITPDRVRLQNLFFDKAEALFGKERYQAQYDAARYYALAGDFGNSVEKEKLAYKRGVLSVAIVDSVTNTALNLDEKTLKTLRNAFPDYYDFETLQGLPIDSLKNNRCALIFTYDSEKFGHYQYAHNKSEMDKQVIKFMQRVTKDGVVSEKEISEKDYNKGKAQTAGTENFNMYQGRMHKVMIESVMTIDYTFGVIDLRQNAKAGQIEKAGRYTMSEVGTEIVTYRGDPQSRPDEKVLVNHDKKMTDADLDKLAKEKKIYGWTMADFLTNRAKEIAKEVEKMVPYHHFSN